MSLTSATPSTANLSAVPSTLDQRHVKQDHWMWNSPRRSDPLGSLSIHPFNASVYGNEEPPDDLVQSMRTVGQLNPIIITKQNLILSGARRYNAAKILGWEVIDTVCIIADNPTKLETQQIIIEANKQRVKSDPQIKAEVRELLRIEKELSGQRRAATLKQNKRAQHTPLAAVPSVPAQHTREPKADPVLATKGRATKIVSEQSDVSHGEVLKVNELEIHAAQGDSTAKSVLNDQTTGITEAHTQWKEISKRKAADAGCVCSPRVIDPKISKQGSVVKPSREKGMFKVGAVLLGSISCTSRYAFGFEMPVLVEVTRVLKTNAECKCEHLCEYLKGIFIVSMDLDKDGRPRTTIPTLDLFFERPATASDKAMVERVWQTVKGWDRP